MAKRKMIPTPADNIAKQIMETYQPQDAQEIQDVVKRIFAPIFEAALKGEMQNHLGYANHERTRVQELYQKWAERKVSNWALVRNQRLMDERMAKLMEHYDTTY